MNNRARVCFVGNGEFANKVHFPSLEVMDNVEIVGICAFNEQRLKETASRYNLSSNKIYVSESNIGYQIMLNDLKPDGVYVIGQPEIMFDVWVWCLQQQFNIYIEKPMGITLHQSRLLAHLAEENCCITQVSHQRRSAPIMDLMRLKCLEKGAITHAVVEFTKCDIQPMLTARDRMLDDFTHSIDTARWICGGEVLRVESTCKRIEIADINWIGATLHFDNGSTCYVIGNWTSGRRIFRVQMHAPGISADVELEKEAQLYIDGDSNGIAYDTKDVANSEELFVFGGFQAKSKEFIESILSGAEKTSSPFSDTIKTMEVCSIILAQDLIGDNYTYSNG